MIDHDDEADPVYEREEWYPWLLNFLADTAEKCPDIFNLAAMEISTPELFRDLQQRALEVEFLGRERASTIRCARDQILGLFDRAYWRRKGLTEMEMGLSENGQVRAIFITPALFEKSPEQFDPCWAHSLRRGRARDRNDSSIAGRAEDAGQVRHAQRSHRWSDAGG